MTFLFFSFSITFPTWDISIIFLLSLAGSVTDLMACMVRAVSFGIPLADAVRAAAVNPAQAIGIFDRVGTLDPGKRANAAVLGPDLELKAVFFHGELV